VCNEPCRGRHAAAKLSGAVMRRAYCPSGNYHNRRQQPRPRHRAGELMQVPIKEALDAAARIKRRGVALIRGTGRITSSGVIDIDGRQIGYRDLVVATGSSPRSTDQGP
jgi:hypothetical protein